MRTVEEITRRKERYEQLLEECPRFDRLYAMGAREALEWMVEEDEDDWPTFRKQWDIDD